MQVMKFDDWNGVPENYTGIIEYNDGTKIWYLNKKYHREDGPAVEEVDGTKWWYLNGNLHREDGPAFEDADGTKEWLLNGKYHREDGPAIEHTDGSKDWYFNDKFVFRLSAKNQPFLILEETEDQVKILTATETKWIKNVPGLKELEGNLPCK